MKIKFFKKKKKFKKGGLIIKPDLCWIYIICVVFIIIIISCTFGFYLFAEINKEPTLPVVNTGEQGIIKKERIDEVLEYFKEREDKSTEILNSPSPIVDPSM